LPLVTSNIPAKAAFDIGETWSERCCRLAARNAAVDIWKGYSRTQLSHGDRAIAMCHSSLLRAFATAGLFLGSSLIADASAETALTVSVDDFKYVDTSNEPTDQTAVHEKRVRTFMMELRDDVTADRRYYGDSAFNYRFGGLARPSAKLSAPSP
jgi:hypothetical protein